MELRRLRGDSKPQEICDEIARSGGVIVAGFTAAEVAVRLSQPPDSAS